MFCAATRRAARAACAADRSFARAGAQDPDLGRRALQFHQHRRRARQFPLRQPAFRQVGARPLHPGRLHRPGRAAPHRLARKDPRPIVLRRLGAKQIVAMLLDECAAGEVDTAFGHPATVEHRDGGFDVSFGNASPAPRRWSSPPAACRSPSLARPASPMTSPAASASRSSSRARLWSRSPCRATRHCSAPCRASRPRSSPAPGKGSFREAALFTHRGLSGPAILQVSSYWRHGDPVAIDFLPDLAPGWLRAAKRAEPAHHAAPLPRPPPPRPPRRNPRRPARPRRRARQPPRPRARRRRGASRRLALHAQWQRGFRQGRSHHRRDQHRRIVVADDGIAAASPASTRSARRSTSPAGSAAIISNGHGPAHGPRRRRSSPSATNNPLRSLRKIITAVAEMSRLRLALGGRRTMLAGYAGIRVGQILHQSSITSRALGALLLLLAWIGAAPAFAQATPAVVEEVKLVTADDSRASFIVRFSPAEPQYSAINNNPIAPRSVDAQHAPRAARCATRGLARDRQGDGVRE